MEGVPSRTAASVAGVGPEEGRGAGYSEQVCECPRVGPTEGCHFRDRDVPLGPLHRNPVPCLPF